MGQGPISWGLTELEGIWDIFPRLVRTLITMPNDWTIKHIVNYEELRNQQEPGRCKGPTMRWKYLILARGVRGPHVCWKYLILLVPGQKEINNRVVPSSVLAPQWNVRRNSGVSKPQA